MENRNERLPPITVSPREKDLVLRRFQSSGMSNFSEWGRRKLLGLDEFGLDHEAIERIKSIFR